MRAALRQANIRENKGPSLNKIQVKLPHRRSPHALKFEDKSQEHTERQKRCARKEKRKLHSFRLPMSGVCRPHSQKNLEESEFVVDSGASLHMVSRKDPNSAELSPLRASKSPTKMVTANDEVQTKGKTTVDVRELD